MKKIANKTLQYATVGKKTQAYQFNFTRKNNIIKNIEIIIACIVAFIAGTGMYEMFK